MCIDMHGMFHHYVYSCLLELLSHFSTCLNCILMISLPASLFQLSREIVVWVSVCWGGQVDSSLWFYCSLAARGKQAANSALHWLWILLTVLTCLEDPQFTMICIVLWNGEWDGEAAGHWVLCPICQKGLQVGWWLLCLCMLASDVGTTSGKAAWCW